MDAGRLSICGEESFGTGSDHIREKDGMWAIVGECQALHLILAPHQLSMALNPRRRQQGEIWLWHQRCPHDALEKVRPQLFLSVSQICSTSLAHLQVPHLTFLMFTFLPGLILPRYDYEECDSDDAEAMMTHLRKLFTSPDFKGSSLKASTSNTTFKVAEADDFSYKDPIDGSVSTKQGLYIRFEDGSRIIFRLSGTGSSGATVRLYTEKYSKDEGEYGEEAQVGLKPLIEVALAVSKMKEFTKREKPDVITVCNERNDG